MKNFCCNNWQSIIDAVEKLRYYWQKTARKLIEGLERLCFYSIQQINIKDFIPEVRVEPGPVLLPFWYCFSPLLPMGPFIYYVSIFFINLNTFTNVLSIFLLFYVLKTSNFMMKISSKCNVEKEIRLFWQKKSQFLGKIRSSNYVLCYKSAYVIYEWYLWLSMSGLKTSDTKSWTEWLAQWVTRLQLQLTIW